MYEQPQQQEYAPQANARPQPEGQVTPEPSTINPAP
jgi:hypothetical protein